MAMLYDNQASIVRHEGGSLPPESSNCNCTKHNCVAEKTRSLQQIGLLRTVEVVVHDIAISNAQVQN